MCLCVCVCSNISVNSSLMVLQRIGSRSLLNDVDGEAQRPQTTAAAERGKAGGGMWIPRLPLHRVSQSSGSLYRRQVVCSCNRTCHIYVLFRPAMCSSERRSHSPLNQQACVPSAPSTARSALRTPRTSRQQQQQQQQPQGSASAGALLRQRLMQGMVEEERELLLKALAGM